MAFQTVEKQSHELKEINLAYQQEIRERKQAEKALRTSHERFLMVLESIDATIYVADLNTYEILFMNQYMKDNFGHDLEGSTCYEVFRNEPKPCSNCTNSKLLNHEGLPTGVHSWEGRNPITGKVYINYDRAIKWTNGQYVRLQIATDITRMKDMEEQLRQSQKMESIGTLSGGIAHDFNNILGIIVGNTELAIEDVPDWNPAHLNLKEIMAASLRAKDIIRQLLSFSRKTGQELRSIGIMTVIKDTLRLLRATIPTTVEIRENIPATDETILADPIQINQIVMNLCINASQEMEKTGGILEVTAEAVTLDEKTIHGYGNLAPGAYVKITISDTGPGIDPDIIGRIYDPYFTTKAVGKGSGMGLAVVHGIVKNHNGEIFVDSQRGKGTTFSIFFPVAGAKQAIKAETLDAIPQGCETILFVDDEASIVKATGQMLKKLGYRVETRVNPLEALELFKEKPHEFDLVITDMTMPQMTGGTLSKKLMEVRRDIPVIICTGYSSQLGEGEAKERGIAGYVMKPIRMRKIAETIREVLGKGGGGD